MASTYTLNNGIELIGTGEQSGTWGDTTNTNLELLDTALDGQVTITAAAAGNSGSPNSLPITDGSASNGRNRLINITSGSDLGATVFYQLTPNDAEKIVYIRNSLNAQDLIVFQGTYNSSNDYLIPNGTTAVVFFNGAGSGAVAANVFNNAHFDAMNVVGGVTITVDDNSTILNLVSTDADANTGPRLDLTRNSASPAANDFLGQIRFMGEDAADNSISYVSMFSQLLDPTDGGEDGSFELDVRLAGSNRSRMISNATETVFNDDGQDINFRIETDAQASAFVIDAADDTITMTNQVVTITHGGNGKQLELVSTDADAGSGPQLDLYRNSASPADNDLTGRVVFAAENDADEKIEYTKVITYAPDVSDGSEDGAIQYYIMKDGSSIQRLEHNPTETVFNQDSADVNFRVESDARANMFYIDGGVSQVGVGMVPDQSWGSNSVGINFGIADADAGWIGWQEISGGDNFHMLWNVYHDNSDFRYASNNPAGKYTQNAGSHIFSHAANGSADAVISFVENLRMNSNGVVFNEGSNDLDFIVESDGNTHAFFVEGNDGDGVPSIGFGVSDPTKLGISGTAALSNNGNGAILQLAGDDSQIRMANHVIHSDNGANTIFHIRNNYGLTNTGAELSLESGHITFNTGSSFTEMGRFNENGHLLLGTQLQSELDEAGIRLIKGASGYVEISRTSTSDGSASVYIARGNDGRAITFFRNDGSNREVGNITVATSSTAYNTSSDYRLKENVTYDWNATTRLKQLKPARFNWIEDETNTLIDGFLAHEAAEAVPESVTGVKDGTEVIGNITNSEGDTVQTGVTKPETDDEGCTWTETGTRPVMQGIDQSKLVPLLVKTIQELEARITALEA